MDQETKNRIFQNIGVLENNPEISPFEAENIYIDILTPLLEEEGYKVTQTASTRDSGIDFTAQKPASQLYKPNKIGIEYKHYRSNQAVPANAVYQVIGYTQAYGFDRAMIITNTRFTSNAIQVAQRELPLSIELINIDVLKSWVARIEACDSIDQLQVEQIIKVVSRRFARLIAENPRNLDKLEWRDIERMLAEVFR